MKIAVRMDVQSFIIGPLTLTHLGHAKFKTFQTSEQCNSLDIRSHAAPSVGLTGLGLIVNYICHEAQNQCESLANL